MGKYGKNGLDLVKQELIRAGLTQTSKFGEAHVFWARSFLDHFPKLKPNQKVNFTPSIGQICRKDKLNTNIQKMISKFGTKEFEFWPMSFNLPKEYEAFRQEYLRDPRPYILKPAALGRGNGITLITRLEEVDVTSSYITKFIPVAQKYIPNPLLFEGHKMTFRIYAAITALNPLRVYVYPQGLARICSSKYSLDTFSDPLKHLTNYDLQMDKEEEFNSSVTGTEMKHDGLRSDLQWVFSWLRDQFNADTDKLWYEIKQLIAKTFLSAEKSFQFSAKKVIPKRLNWFGLVGFDVLIDTDMKPWLLEVNRTPALGPHTQLENDIKSSMLRDLFKLVDITNSQKTQLSQRTQKIEDALKQERKRLRKLQREKKTQSLDLISNKTQEDDRTSLHQTDHSQTDVERKTEQKEESGVEEGKSEGENSAVVVEGVERGRGENLVDEEEEEYIKAWDDNGIINPVNLSRFEVWTILETEFEFARKGDWERAFPEVDSIKYFPILPLPNNRNKLLIHWLREGRHSDQLLNWPQE